MMEVAKSETFKKFSILYKALLFLIKLNKIAVQSVPKKLFFSFCIHAMKLRFKTNYTSFLPSNGFNYAVLSTSRGP